MLMHVYRRSPRLLEDVLRALLDEDGIEIGPLFEQQVGATHSIPDAVISQAPLHIYFEAKRGDGLTDDQVERHLQSIYAKKHPENSAFLIGLTINNASAEDSDRWSQAALKLGITFTSTTYRDLLEVLSPVCANDPDLREVLDDFQTFIAGEGLLPDQHCKVVALLCGQSWRENIAHGAYFEPAHRSPKWTRAHFIGVYRQKQISHVGRLEAVAVCRKNANDLIIENEEFGSLTKEHMERIEKIIDAASYYPDFAAESHRYYVVDRFAPTDVRKISSGGMMGHRYLNIAELAKVERFRQDASSDEVASLLSGTVYE